MPTQIIAPELQIRKLTYKTLRELADLLDINGPCDWRALIAEFPDNYTYSHGQIARFEREGYRPGCSSALALLTDLGHQLMTVGELCVYLERINHQEALLLVRQHEPVFITRQPTSQIVQYGQDIELKCEASGFPKPRYQWYKENVPIRMQCAPVLRIDSATEDATGDYYCAVTNPIGTEYTEVVGIQVTPQIAKIVDGVTAPKSEISSFPNNTLHPSIEEEIVILYIGQYFELKCFENAQNYQWYKNGYEIVNEIHPKLIFQQFQQADEGHYSCKITNQDGKEIITRLANLKVQGSNIVVGPRGPFRNQEFATAKLALVIANEKYEFAQNANEVLIHPVDDAKLLTDTLQKIGFKVTCLVNLNKYEMVAAIEGFCKLLKCTKGVYSLFYFCGHGFEEHGKTYLVPTDAPAEWHAETALSAEYVLSKIQHCKTTKLDVLLLDVCRISTGLDASIPEFRTTFDPPFLPGAQCVFGYATCPQSQAFEKRRDTNGIYMKHLAQSLTQNIQIEHLLHTVGRAVREETERHHVTNIMSPTFKTTTTREFSLCDNVLPTGFVEGELDPMIFWFDFHRLPSSQTFEFANSVLVEMRFVPVCSNICNIVIQAESLNGSRCCDAKVTSVTGSDVYLPLDSMNQERDVLPEFLAKSLQFDSNASSSSASSQPAKIERWTILYCLQKLMGDLTIALEIEYIPSNSPDQQLQRCLHDHIVQNREFGIISFFNT